MAAGIIASMLYLAVIERSTDLATSKAMGVSNGTLFGGLALQGMVLALLATAVGAVLALLIAPAFPFPVEIPTSAYVTIVDRGCDRWAGGQPRRLAPHHPASTRPLRSGRDVGGVTVRGLALEYERGGYVVRPIDGLDLDAADGELVLLVGSSGCGKTTLLSALASLLRPAAGTITVGDVEVTALDGRAATSTGGVGSASCSKRST